MKIAVFGNYILVRKIISILKEKAVSFIWISNKDVNNDKYGDDLEIDDENRIYDDENLYGILNEYSPDFGLSVGYKKIINISLLNFSVYGVHLGGIYGENAIRGKNAYIWAEIFGYTNIQIAFYKLNSNKFDTGEIIKEKLISLKNLVANELDFIEEITIDSLKNNLQPCEYSKRLLATYYPKVSKIGYFNTTESNGFIDILNKHNLIDNNLIITSQVYERDFNGFKFFEYIPSIIEKDDVFYFHGLASSGINYKLNTLCKMLKRKVIAPQIKSINRNYNDTPSTLIEVFFEIDFWLKSFNKPNVTMIFSSISSLLFISLLKQLDKSIKIIHLTPIVNLNYANIDDKLKSNLNLTANKFILTLSNGFYNGFKLTSDFIEWLLQINFFASLNDIENKVFYLLTSRDSTINTENTRQVLLQNNIDIEKIKIIEGEHAFNSLEQLYFLNSLINVI